MMFGLQPRKTPIWFEARSSKWAIGCAAFAACFTDGFLYGSIVPVLPFELPKRFHIPEEDTQFWISLLLAIFGAFLAAGAPLSGWAADRSARSTPFLCGLVLATVATLMFWFARAPAWLVVARVLQGLSASVVYTAGLALVTDAVGPDEVGAWVGFIFSGLTFGLLISPFIAGLVYDRAGYYAVFGTVFGVIGLDFLLRAFMIEKRTAVKYLPCPEAPVRQTDPTDPESARGANNNNNANDIDDHTPLLLPPSPKSHPSPQTPPTLRTLLLTPRLLAAVHGCFTFNFLYGSLDAILPLFVQRTFHWSASNAGLVFLAVSGPSLLGPLCGGAADRYGARVVALAGIGLAAGALGLMGVVVRGDDTGSEVALCGLLVAVGTGLNLILAPLTADVFATVRDLSSSPPQGHPQGIPPSSSTAPSLSPPEGSPSTVYAQAYSMMTISWGVGNALGPVVAGALYARAGWAASMGVLALVTAAPGVGVAVYTGRRK